MRMWNPATALLWRQWREASGAALFVSCGIGAFLIVYTYAILAGEGMEPSEFEQHVLAIAAFGAVALAGAMLYADNDPRRLTGAPPNHLLTLPVKTIHIAAALLVFRTAAVGISLAIGTQSVLIWFRWWAPEAGGEWAVNVVSRIGLPVTLGGMALYAYAQCVVWTALRISTALALVCLAAVPWTIASFTVQRLHELTFYSVPAIGVFLALAAASLPFVRTGFFDRFAYVRPNLAWDRQRKPFSGPSEALRWYAYRRSGYWLTRAVVAAVVVFAPLFAVLRQSGVWRTAGHAPVSHMVVGWTNFVLATTYVAALSFGVIQFLSYYRDGRSGGAGSMFVLPVRTERIAVALFRASIRSVGVCAAACGVAFLALTVVNKGDSLFAIETVRTWSVSVLGLAVLMSALYLFAAPFILLLAVIMAPAMLFGQAMGSNLYDASMAGVLIALLPGIPAASAYAYTRGALGVKSGEALFVAALLFFVVGHIFAVMSGNASGLYKIPNLAFGFIAVAPLAFWPAYLAWLRTR